MAKSRSPEPTYFLDENLASAELEARLVAHGMTCVRITTVGPPFRANMTDAEWIPAVAERGWWAVTRDASTLRVAEERAAIERCASVHIVVRGKGLSIEAIASMLISAHGRLVARLAKLRRPVFVDLYANGTCKITGDRRGAPPKTE